jgi:hypothetical protein
MPLSDERRDSAAVAEANDENVVEIHEGIFAKRIERCSIAAELGLEIGFATVSAAFADARLVQAHGGEA